MAPKLLVQLLQRQTHAHCYDVACRDCSAAPPWFIFRAATSFSRWLRMLPRKLEPAPIALLAELNGMMSTHVVRVLSPALATRPSSKGRVVVLHGSEPGSERRPLLGIGEACQGKHSAQLLDPPSSMAAVFCCRCLLWLS